MVDVEEAQELGSGGRTLAGLLGERDWLDGGVGGWVHGVLYCYDML